MSRRIIPFGNHRASNRVVYHKASGHLLTDHTLHVGFLGRDRTTWLQSLTYIERLERLLDAKIVYGHDSECFYEMKQLPQFYT